ncbi:MAG: class I tRNA ligase family protein, partial [Gammaproteobacteria bacterium]|nr:class I tRNA ligase family protein [Gammaproteobacteria bacterium]
GYLQIDKEKMSKSLGNFFTIRDVLKDHHPEVLRYLLITSHYRSPIHYSQDSLEQAKNALTRFYTALRDLPEAEPLKDSEFEKKFISAMNDDFNTPIAFSVLFELVHEIQRVKDHNLLAAAQLGALLKQLSAVLGILQNDPQTFLQMSKEEIDIQKVEALIVARNQARLNKNWGEADRIRTELQTMSIELEDSAEGTRWKSVTK